MRFMALSPQMDVRHYVRDAGPTLFPDLWFTSQPKGRKIGATGAETQHVIFKWSAMTTGSTSQNLANCETSLRTWKVDMWENIVNSLN